MTAPTELDQGAFFELSHRVRLRLSGSDRVRFLNGQVTNDVAKATDSSAIPACVLNTKGRMDAYIFISSLGDSLLIDADLELRDTIKLRLERYIIADDVAIDDLSDDFVTFHLLTDRTPEIANRGRIVSVNRLGRRGFDVIVPPNQREHLFDELSKLSRFCDPACAEVFRVEQGIPRWGRELSEEINPIEANLEESCIDYGKGCYIGQEVISRMKMSGQRNKQLCGFLARSQDRLAPNLRLFSSSPQPVAREVGFITSAVESSRIGGMIGLGYVKRGFNASGTELEARGDGTGPSVATLTIVDLPFSSPRTAVEH